MWKRVVAQIARKISYIRKQYEEQEYLNGVKHGDSCTICYPTKIVGEAYINMGNNVYVGPNSRIEAIDRYDTESGIQKFSPKIILESGVKIQGNCHIGAIYEIRIMNNVLMGNGVFITDHAHGKNGYEELSLAPYNRQLFSRGKVVIEKNVWICENAVILPGVTVGQGSIIAAGAVVTTDIPPFAVAGGVPARIMKVISK